MKAVVLMTTVRIDGLEWQLPHFATQTCKDFAIVIVDAYYHQRKYQIEGLTAGLGLTVLHVPLPTLTYVTELTHASNRNAGLAAAIATWGTTPTFIFFDDYQIPSSNFVETHIGMSQPHWALAGRQVSLWFNKDRDYAKPFEYAADELEHEDARVVSGYQECPIDASAFWTGNASMVIPPGHTPQWFDERMNGGTGGEDGDFGLRGYQFQGRQLFFTSKCYIYHISHKHVTQLSYKDNIPKQVDLSLCNHDRAPFTCNQYQQGDFYKEEAGSLYTWRDPSTGIKYYVCKNCGLIGCIDSIEVLNYNKSTWEDVGLLRTVEGHHDYPPIKVTKDLFTKLTELYINTPFTYYQNSLYY